MRLKSYYKFLTFCSPAYNELLNVNDYVYKNVRWTVFFFFSRRKKWVPSAFSGWTTAVSLGGAPYPQTEARCTPKSPYWCHNMRSMISLQDLF